MLWGRLPLALPLTDRLRRLSDRLATRRLPPEDTDPALRWAAVAVILVPFPDSFLLIRRAERDGDPWSGHLALPGGRREPGDVDLLDTAVREVWEEVGVHLDREALAGRLADVIPRTPTLPPIAVRPHVFVIANRPGLVINPEVSEAEWVTVDHLLHADTYHPVSVEIGGEARRFPAYHLEDSFIWGMTERILTDLLDEFRRSES